MAARNLQLYGVQVTLKPLVGVSRHSLSMEYVIELPPSCLSEYAIQRTAQQVLRNELKKSGAGGKIGHLVTWMEA